MNSTATARTAFVPVPAPVATGRDVEILSRLNDPDTALAIWRRDLPHGLARWLAALDPAQLPDTRLLVKTGDLPAAIDAMIAASPLPAVRERQRLADDVFTLAWRFATFLGLDAVDIRLERVVHDGCWK
ncbi:MAG: DUF1826 domain-containing protein, partial [Zavarzinia sp.]|nr:DUF1826 domain-containing protein [Zavarzinia sp.]